MNYWDHLTHVTHDLTEAGHPLLAFVLSFCSTRGGLMLIGGVMGFAGAIIRAA